MTAETPQQRHELAAISWAIVVRDEPERLTRRHLWEAVDWGWPARGRRNA